MLARRISALKYLTTISLPICLAIAFMWRGWWSWLPLAYAFGMIPLLELFLNPRTENMDAAEEAVAKADPFYDWLVYIMVGIQYLALFTFLWVVTNVPLTLMEGVGLVFGMGLMCGVFGINVGHELGHRTKKHEKVLAKLALLTSLYMHFFIEHNRGHHKRVATEEDPATARYGELVYTFWARSIFYSYLSAWKLESVRLKRKKLPLISWHNEMIRFQVFQLALLLGIGLVFGWLAVVYFLPAALIGILLLETVNYIEHYGLERERKDERYERVRPHHSWNSDHVLGRLLLFELSRHSDHHFQASRKYQILRHYDTAPQMPTGYPGMMVMALMPPIWFKVMHRKLAAIG
ncbi:MAG: alkane 1-monooxygenase [Bacteroidota bacterium]